MNIRIVKQHNVAREIVSLFNLVFRGDMTLEFWEWKYGRNPANNLFGDNIIVAIDRERVIGVRPLLFAVFESSYGQLLGAQPCDTMVHPEYRRRGIFSEMNSLAIEYCKRNGVNFFYNFPGEMSRPGYLKQGWKVNSNIEHLILVNRPDSVFMDRLKNRYLSSAAAFFYRNFFAKEHDGEHDANVGFKVYSLFPDGLEIPACGGKGVDISRNNAYLKWRFDQHPRKKYKYVIMYSESQVIGYSVINVEVVNRCKYGYINDYIICSDNYLHFDALIAMTLRQVADVDLVFVWERNRNELRNVLTRAFGFKSSTHFPFGVVSKETRSFVVRSLDPDVLDLHDNNNWNITMLYPDPN